MNDSTLDTGTLIRRLLFFIVLIVLTLGNLLTMFRCLNSPQAMDQAQIAREIARGNGITTKFIRPVAYHQAQEAQGTTVPFVNFRDSYHAPLNPLVNAAVLKLVGADDPEVMKMGENDLVYELDRVIAMVSTIFFLLAIGVSYLLIARIFDAKIAGVCAILMLFSESLWSYSMSGLPQMLMLLLFCCALYFIYRAIELSEDSRVALAPALLAGFFLTLLAMTHYLTIWILLGYIIFAAIAFRPRGMVGISVLVMLLIPASYIIYRNLEISDHPFGTAFLTLYNGLGGSSEVGIMRVSDLSDAPSIVDGLMGKVLRTTLLQFVDIVPLLAGIIVAPLFFIALLHPFKRKPIATFRWAILIMWVTAALGMAFFGTSSKDLDPNQLHLLFAPIMAAYGLAFISVLWARLEIVAATPMLRNVLHIVVIAICALPLILALPQKVKLGLTLKDRGGLPHYPPYMPAPLNRGLRTATDPNHIIFSDQPWAVAWYADRMSIWLPPSIDSFETFEGLASDLQTPTTGILITPSSHGSASAGEVVRTYGDFASYVMDGVLWSITAPARIPLTQADPTTQEVHQRYPYAKPLHHSEMIYYSDRIPRITNTP